MPRTALTPVAVAAKCSVAGITPGDLDLTFEAADDASGNYFVPTGKDLILVLNSGVGAATFTLDCAPDQFGRDGAITTYSVAAGTVSSPPGVITTPAYQQTDGYVHLDASSSDIGFCILQLP